MTREEALKILEDLKNSPNMIKHALAAGYVMGTLYDHFNSSSKNPEMTKDDWEIVGILHDADYEVTDKSLDRHTDETIKRLKERNVSQEIIDAIQGHCDKAPRKTLMAKSIYACDELTGLIVACALVRPDKKLASVTTDSVLKKFKEKSFAAGANRDQIKTCESELGMPLDQFIEITLKSMQEHASDLGL